MGKGAALIIIAGMLSVLHLPIPARAEDPPAKNHSGQEGGGEESNTPPTPEQKLDALRQASEDDTGVDKALKGLLDASDKAGETEGAEKGAAESAVSEAFAKLGQELTTEEAATDLISSLGEISSALDAIEQANGQLTPQQQALRDLVSRLTTFAQNRQTAIANGIFNPEGGETRVANNGSGGTNQANTPTTPATRNPPSNPELSGTGGLSDPGKGPGTQSGTSTNTVRALPLPTSEPSNQTASNGAGTETPKSTPTPKPDPVVAASSKGNSPSSQGLQALDPDFLTNLGKLEEQLIKEEKQGTENGSVARVTATDTPERPSEVATFVPKAISQPKTSTYSTALPSAAGDQTGVGNVQVFSEQGPDVSPPPVILAGARDASGRYFASPEESNRGVRAVTGDDFFSARQPQPALSEPPKPVERETPRDGVVSVRGVSSGNPQRDLARFQDFVSEMQRTAESEEEETTVAEVKTPKSNPGAPSPTSIVVSPPPQAGPASTTEPAANPFLQFLQQVKGAYDPRA